MNFIKALIGLSAGICIVLGKHVVPVLADSELPVWLDLTGTAGLIAVLVYAVIHLWKDVQRHRNRIDELQSELKDGLQDQLHRLGRIEDSIASNDE